MRIGEELGYFLHGGSSVVALFPRGAVAYDSDLVHNSKLRVETLLRMGSRIGVVQNLS